MDAIRLCLWQVTISADADRLIRIAQIRDMAEAVAIDSLCSVAVEQACDRAELIIKRKIPDITRHSGLDLDTEICR